MSSLKTKIVVVPLLLFILIILLFLNSGQNPAGQPEKSVKSKEEIKASLSAEIDSVLYSFGIKKDWIKNLPVKNSSEWFSKEIQISNDIYAGSVISDLVKYLNQYDLILESREDFIPGQQVPGNMSAQIKDIQTQPEIIVANIILIYKDYLKRDAGDICIVLNNFESIEHEKALEIINNPNYFSFVMPNTFEAVDLQALMIDLKSDYINCFELGEADNYQADFREQKDNPRNQRDNIQKIHQICNDYDKEKVMVLLNPLKYNETQTFIVNGLSKCRGNIFTDTLLITVDLRNEKGNDKIDFAKLIKEKTGNGLIKKAILLSIDGDNYASLLDTVSKMEKAGYRFYGFKEFVKKFYPDK